MLAIGNLDRVQTGDGGCHRHGSNGFAVVGIVVVPRGEIVSMQFRRSETDELGQLFLDAVSRLLLLVFSAVVEFAPS